MRHLTSTVLQVSWIRPEHPNGILSGFRITCRSTSGSRHRYFFGYRPSSYSHAYLIDNLTPYTVYYCSILATNGAGDGMSAGPQVTRTPQDSKLNILCCVSCILKALFDV